MSFSKLLLQLKILGRVPPHGRIRKGLNGIIAIEEQNYWTNLKRFVFRDGRQSTVEEIKEIMAECSEKTMDLMNSRFWQRNDDENHAYPDDFKILYESMNQLHQELSGAIDGISNLKTTYHDDPMTISQLDIIINNMKFLLNRICQFI